MHVVFRASLRPHLLGWLLHGLAFGAPAGAEGAAGFGSLTQEWFHVSPDFLAWPQKSELGPKSQRAREAADDSSPGEPRANRTSPGEAAGGHDEAPREGGEHGGGNATQPITRKAIRTTGEHESLVSPVNMTRPRRNETPPGGNETAPAGGRAEEEEGEEPRLERTSSSTPKPLDLTTTTETTPRPADHYVGGSQGAGEEDDATEESSHRAPGGRGARAGPANATPHAVDVLSTTTVAALPTTTSVAYDDYDYTDESNQTVGYSAPSSQAKLTRLWTHLFGGGYIKDEPPVPHGKGPLRVGVGMNFVKIQDIDEVAGTMNMALNLRLYWDDARLAFHASDFFNTSHSLRWERIPLMSDMVWTPDITIMNQLGQAELLDPGVTPVTLADDEFRRKFSVNVMWTRPIEARSTCDVDMSQFPFDQQNCRIRVASWASSKAWVELVPQQFFETKTIQHGEFNVQEISVNKTEIGGAAADGSFDEVRYYVRMERQSHYYVINFILPMLALTLLTVGTMFMSTSNMGQRINGGAKFLLCVVSIIFLTARYRPAISGDVWMDSFQAHCLAISMSAVLESLVIDVWSKADWFDWVPEVPETDALLRATIIWVTTISIFMDAYEVKRYNCLQLYTSFHSNTTVLLVGFVYVMLVGLIVTSTTSFCWVIWAMGAQPPRGAGAVKAAAAAKLPGSVELGRALLQGGSAPAKQPQQALLVDRRFSSSSTQAPDRLLSASSSSHGSNLASSSGGGQAELAAGGFFRAAATSWESPTSPSMRWAAGFAYSALEPARADSLDLGDLRPCRGGNNYL